MKNKDAPFDAGPDFLQGGGELGALIRARDWSGTPLGAPQGWPQSLRTAVSLCLVSGFPISIIWGPQRTQLYNDRYRDCCGDAHPRALGADYRETWASAWPAIGESFERALAGETVSRENQRMFLRRLGGRLEEAFLTFSHSPIRDESGRIAGVFHPVAETTTAMLAERRAQALRELGTCLELARDEADVARRTVQALAAFEWDVPLLLYYRFDAALGGYRLAGCHGVRAGSAAAPQQLSPQAVEPWPVAQALRTARMVEAGHLPALLQGEPCGPYEEPPATAFVIPLATPLGPPAPALLVAGVSARLPLTETYRSFLALLGVALSNALVALRARVDEQRRVQALAEIDRAKTAFFSNVSHEFRTPLTLMLAPLEELLAGAPLEGAVREPLRVVHRNGLRLLRLVNTLLDFSRVEAGRARARYEPTDLAALTADLASSFRSACEAAGLALVIDCPPLPETVFVDREMWEKVVLNLLSNAFKFTFEGRITVAVRQQGAHAVLTVRDTGTGIPAHELPRVFERFHRVEAARGRSHEGSGIGLALVQELVKLHGGTVQLASTWGEGSCFTVQLPLGRSHLSADHVSGADEQPLASTATRPEAFVEEALRWLPASAARDANASELLHGLPDPPLAHLPPTERARVLLVEDNADMRGYVARLLSPGFDVEAVADAQAALAAVQQQVPELVLADVMLPGLDGLALLQALRARESTRELPVILLTARASEDSRVHGMQSGADDYIVKPFSARELVARVEAHVKLARLRRESRERLEQCVAERTQELQTLATRQRRLLQHLETMQDEERRRIARELHDSLGQQLTAVSLALGALHGKLRGRAAGEDVAEVRRALEVADRDLDRLVFELRPAALEHGGLHEGITAYVSSWSALTGQPVDLLLRGLQGRALPVHVELAVFRVVQEALNNIAKHARSRSVSVSVECFKARLVASVEDDGVGFDAARALDVEAGQVNWGLVGMRERIEALGGSFEIESRPGEGTAVLWRVPLRQQAPG
ncbi:ATP-binding protein [Azohydromonas aeria]|uniref:ATP-binding protein n=1 Tax=Azohydromonas aeria TaxID=2590212 RepID=UPI0012F8E9F2|nr:ATP-binding protein [Azohydromonas aeria]